MRGRAICMFVLLLLSARAASARGEVTFNNQIVRILQQHCQSCHRPGNIAPFSLITYDDTWLHASQIRSAVTSRQMPPWKPEDAHDVFQGERYLTDQETRMISEWIDAGVPEGNASDLPPPIDFPQRWSLGVPDVVAQPASSFPLDAGAEDIYRCFPIIINSPTDLYIRGYEVLPGNRSVVHHVLLFIDANGSSAALDDADPGPGYTCFGGPSFNNGLGGIGGWAPGAAPQVFPLGTGVRLPKGARIVMQVHYSPAHASQSGGALDPDLTRVGLYTSGVPLEELSFLPIVNPFFTIPANDPHYQVRAFLPILRTLELVSIAPHMHLLGREIKVTAHFSNGSTRQLIRIDDWDFHWQGDYTYREPVTLPAGTLLELTAFYDNSSGNPNNPSNPPVPVSWGERTVDEMCLTFITVKTPGIRPMNTVPFSLTDRSSASIVTQSASAAMQSGYARVTEDSGAVPSGVAIFGYKPAGVLVSEAGIAGSRLITRGRMYAETNGPVKTGLAVVNPNAESAVLSFTFTDEAGSLVYSGSVTMGPNSQLTEFLTESPFNGPAAFSGSLTLASTKPLAAIGIRGVSNERSEFVITTLPVVDLDSFTAGTAAVFPQFADGGGWTTTIMLVNPTDELISGTLQMMDSAGRPSTSFNYSIRGKSARQFATGGSGDSVRVGAVAVVPSAGTAMPSGSLVFSYRRSGVRVTEAGVPLVPPGNTFRIYAEASGNIQSGIAIANTTSAKATVRLELINMNGVSVSSTALTLPPLGQLSRFLTELPGFDMLSLPVQGLLRISSTTPIAVTGLRSRTNERGDLLITTTPPVSESISVAPELFFPQFADGAGYTTQFVLFGSGAQTSMKGTIRFYSQSGSPMGLRLR